MEANHWPKAGGLAYQFFQWVRLCDESLDLNNINVFEPTSSLSFPVRDFNVKAKVIEVNFLSLLGAMSPLPHHFNMPMLSPSKESEAFYEFIAVLNRLFYRALYAAWKSNHLHFFKKDRAMYHEMLSPYASTPWLARPYLQYTPTMMGLRALLYRLCEDVPVDVSYEKGFQTLSSGFCKLGDALQKRLSDNAILGQRVLSHEGKLGVTVGPLLCAQARQWMPTEKMGKKVLTQVKHYLGVGFELKWRVMIASQDAVACLGRRDALSRYAFLGKSGRPRTISLSC
ncbi:MAG: type VI secretion system baseplate subunit TssG [Gammaproteobacteria bacterium]